MLTLALLLTKALHRQPKSLCRFTGADKKAVQVRLRGFFHGNTLRYQT